MLNKLIVNAYKIAGFVILTCVLVGLASYVVTTGFYYASSSWLAPIIVSPSDKRVLELNAQLAQQQSLRDALGVQKAESLTKLRDAERVAAAEEQFQAGLRLSLKADLDDRRRTSATLAALRREYVAASAEIATANEDFAGLSRDRIKEMFQARLATRDDVLKGNMELASLANANLGLKERSVMLGEQVSAAERQADSLAFVEASLVPGVGYGPRVAFQSGDSAAAAPTREVLTAKREFELSVLAAQRAREQAEAIKQGVAAADVTLRRYDALLASIKESPYLKAVDHHLTIAFVPYTNDGHAQFGTAVYACKLNIVWCRRVGRVGARLEGEVVGHHPMQKVDLRGEMVRLDLDDADAAREPVLHLGRAPLFF
jgi:hypothetical protein